jgi:hypothetical protein
MTTRIRTVNRIVDIASVSTVSTRFRTSPAVSFSVEPG